MFFLVSFFFVIFIGFFDYFYVYLFFLSFVVCLFIGGSDLFSGYFFLDGVSFFLVFLSIWLFLFCLFSNLSDKWKVSFSYDYFFVNVMIFFLLFVSFFCFNFFVFYISFEFIFLFMFIFLLGWGYSFERVQASFYMVFYTLVVSFPFLIFLILNWSFFVSSSFFSFVYFSSYWWFFVFLVFLVKLPVYGVHLWLPKAHVEAPVAGSMVLAGALLKLGGYGIFRFSYFVGGLFMNLSGYLFSIGLVGGLFSCFLCVRQVDLKSFVAYSSVCHMGMALAGFCSYLSWGFGGFIYMMIGHGFCSSCLFYILYLLYKRFYTRSLLVGKGLLSVLPIVGFFWFVFMAFNMGVPPSLSFFSEIFIVSGVFSVSLICGFALFFLLVFSGVYGIYLFVLSFHGVGFLGGFGFDVSVREHSLMYGHFYYMLFVPLFFGYFF